MSLLFKVELFHQKTIWWYIFFSMWIKWVFKGQLISKGLFGILEFFQKTNERILFYYCWAKNPNLFVCFLEESSACKKHYDSVWTLSNLHKENVFSRQI